MHPTKNDLPQKIRVKVIATPGRPPGRRDGPDAPDQAGALERQGAELHRAPRALRQGQRGRRGVGGPDRRADRAARRHGRGHGAGHRGAHVDEALLARRSSAEGTTSRRSPPRSPPSARKCAPRSTRPARPATPTRRTSSPRSPATSTSTSGSSRRTTAGVTGGSGSRRPQAGTRRDLDLDAHRGARGGRRPRRRRDQAHHGECRQAHPVGDRGRRQDSSQRAGEIDTGPGWSRAAFSAVSSAETASATRIPPR